MRWLLGAVLVLAACRAEVPAEFDGALAFRHVETQLAFGPRVSGTAAAALMGDWLDSLLRARADTVVVQTWNHVTRRGDTLALRNFIARFRPKDPQRILLLAHWDTRPTADGPSSQSTAAPVPGANDGASGVAVLLGIAEALHEVPPAVGVDLLFVDAEDYGVFPDQDVLLGSTHYAQSPLPGPKPLFAVLLDMVGDRDLQIYQEGNSVAGAPEVVSLVWETARNLGHGDVFRRSTRYTLTDDHIPLLDAGFRAIDIIDFDYPSWHTPDDTADKVSARSLQVVGSVIMAVIRTMTNDQ